MSHVFSRPNIAWPTLLLALACLLGHVLAWSLALKGHYGLALVVGSVFAYAAFTPLHDATHRSVGRAPWLSALVGRAMAPLIGGSFPAFRFVHLTHHAHTNDGHKDPDHYSARGPRLLLPLRWATQDLYYYAFILKSWRTRPLAERIELVAVVVIELAVIGALIANGLLLPVLFAWILPARVAITLLSFAFDYLPHVPHQVPAREDRVRATRNIESKILQVLFLNQNLHRVHHFFPGVPWFAYGEVLAHRQATGEEPERARREPRERPRLGLERLRYIRVSR